ncbi:MAG TPA: branched-chain amino acid ABC transporter permease [Deltaproteobacteria bacterium]|nr:branched-chain amino acid ABC transporter permease [Deltaproteobacteria bacterium]
MVSLLQLVCAGLANGVTYAVAALGFVIIYKCSRVFNIAQGHFVMLGGYFAYTFLSLCNLSVWTAIVAATATGLMLGLVIQRIAMRPMIGQPLLAAIMMTIVIGMVMEGSATLAWGGKYAVYHGTFGGASISLGQLSLPEELVAQLIISLLTVIVFSLFFQHTKIGLAMRATAEDEQVAQSCGIKVNLVYGLAWMIAGATGAIAGLVLGEVCGASPSLSEIGMKAFAVALVGGLESIPGVLVAGLTIGISEIIASTYLDPLLPTGGGLASVFPYLVMMIVLTFKPYGFFGLERIERI